MSSTLQKSEKIQLKRKGMIKSDVNYVLCVKEYVGVSQSHYKLPRNTEHSAFFSYFYWGQSSKILQHRKKERFDISEAAKLNSSLLQTCEEITPQNHEILTVFCMVGCKFLPPTMETCICKIMRLCETILAGCSFLISIICNRYAAALEKRKL